MISFKGVSVDFGSHTLLNNITLQIKPGEFVFLVGQTGSGKSTVLRLIYMDILPSRGAVFVGKHCSASIQTRDIPLLRRELGVVFQDFKLLDDRSVYDNVAFTLHVTGARSADIRKKVMLTLGDVGLSHARNKMSHELSGGEQQRVAIARALVNNPKFLLADEPTGNLDPATSLEILTLLKNINMRGTAVVMATHNYDIVRRAKERIVKIEDGAVHEVDGPF
jgi:cell division transport system ATP-binding protein